ncbi:amidohydrolase [Stieleria sp. TO1_6]|uniref:amidohydrolase family protein n=1 Tax=Stieleria tagensis TaxID=2956795 RepID=UPI00209AE60B|nr:amidohydrolase family protein [Stieleria tagensis]MCO8120809.1 amidohydrolase [Stieleria tagensis]
MIRSGIAAMLVGIGLTSSTAAQSNTSPADGPPSNEQTDIQTDTATPLASDRPLEEPLDGRDGRELLLRNFRPKSQLIVAQHPRSAAAMPVVDVHTHFHYKLRENQQELDDFVALMDRNHIAVCVSLDGRLGDQLDRHIKFLWTKYQDRFAIFANVDWRGNAPIDEPALWPCHRPGFAERTAELLEQAAERGVSGLKLFKRFGLRYRNPDGTLIKIDDPRWDPIWAKCGELGLPIIIHTADPAAFFDPVDETNERWEELSRHPDWSFYGDEYPSRDELLAARNRMIQRHPKTQFIGAHIANSAEDLSTVAGWLDTYPNLWIEPASRIGELGRQPFTARDFLIRYQDRLLFGTDGPWPEARLRLYWRFFETHDESFAYSEKVPPPQGMWQIYGVDLPQEVLQKLYFANASRLIPGIKQRLDSWHSKHSND